MEKIMGLLEAGLASSPAEQTEIVVMGQDCRLTRYSENYIHQNVGERGYQVTVRAITGKRIGSASTNQLDVESVVGAVREAHDMSSLAPEKPDFKSLPHPEPIAQPPAGTSRATADCAADLRAAYVQRVVNMAADKGLRAVGSMSTEATELAVANSLGVRAHFADTRATLTCIAMSKDSSGYGEETAVDVARIDPTRVAEKAISKCLLSRDPIAVPTGEYDVILEPGAVSQMILYLAFLGFSAESYQEGRSFMSGRLGQKITGDNITIWDDGLDPAGFPLPFDFEGVPKQKIMLIENGVASGVAYDSLTAGREGRKSTGHSVSQTGYVACLPVNMLMAPGSSSVPEMIASTKKGILVTRFHYVNPVEPMKTIITGMTRDGTFLVEDGRIVHGLKNMRFTESVLGAFSRVEAISRDRSLEGGLLSIVMPAIKVKGFTFTGSTEF
jgi:predicted Zn-dependent protease